MSDATVINELSEDIRNTFDSFGDMPPCALKRLMVRLMYAELLSRDEARRILAERPEDDNE